MAARNFAGGLRQAEKVGILNWIVGISELIQAEINEEKREAEERASWSWRTGDWTGRERERERAFMKSFIDSPNDVPEWTVQEGAQPSAFLSYFASGLHLVKLHNVLVAKSARTFENIKSIHVDTTKPYRRAENLRFWKKAAELRWDIFFQMDVMGVATLGEGKDDTARSQIWKAFDEALLQWCGSVRKELVKEWTETERRMARGSPKPAEDSSPVEPAATVADEEPEMKIQEVAPALTSAVSDDTTLDSNQPAPAQIQAISEPSPRQT
jgi:hypothetical protein